MFIASSLFIYSVYFPSDFAQVIKNMAQYLHLILNSSCMKNVHHPKICRSLINNYVITLECKTFSTTKYVNMKIWHTTMILDEKNTWLKRNWHKLIMHDHYLTVGTHSINWIHDYMGVLTREKVKRSKGKKNSCARLREELRRRKQHWYRSIIFGSLNGARESIKIDFVYFIPFDVMGKCYDLLYLIPK